MRAVRQTKVGGRTKNQQEHERLSNFFSTHYGSTVSQEDAEKMKMKNITQILDYAATHIVTEYETNVKQHFVEYVERFINVVFDKKQQWKDLDDDAKTEFTRRLRSYKSSALEWKRDGLPPDLQSHFDHIIPPSIITSDKHVNYELAKNPQAFLPCMVYIMRYVESKGEKTINVFPCRTDIVPKYITFDTVSLISLLLKDKDRRGEPMAYFKNPRETGTGIPVAPVFQRRYPLFRPWK